ncbi:MAG: hypothetical protein ACI9NC_006330, partial [Verrucomicrobiales bacterium]
NAEEMHRAGRFWGMRTSWGEWIQKNPMIIIGRDRINLNPEANKTH